MEWLGLFNAIPILRWLIKKKLERRMDVVIRPLGIDPYRVTLGEFGSIKAHFELTLRNHRTKRGERISRAAVVLRHRRFRFRHRDLSAEIALDEIAETVLEPQSAAMIQTFHIRAPGPSNLPEKAELVLRLYLVGPKRKFERTLTGIWSPKAPKAPPHGTIVSQG